MSVNTLNAELVNIRCPTGKGKMALNSKIEWTEATWNPATGCSKISDGCANCYAERLAHRLKAMGNRRYANGFALTPHHDLIDLPLKWREPKFVFVNSMSDLFHEEMPLSFIQSVFKTMEKADRHVFQILTKRSHRLLEVSNKISWPSNVWMGVTVESHKYTHRISDLQRVPAKMKFLSIEPLLSHIPELPLSGIDWVIIGGESGPRCRSVQIEWVRSVRDQCVEKGVPFFFKQWGGVRKKASGRLLDGKIWSEKTKKKNNRSEHRLVYA